MNPHEKKVLYIFATSDVPDVYINTIGHCTEHYPPIQKVVLLSIVKDKGLLRRTDNFLREISNNISRQLNLLQKGKYLRKDQVTKEWTDDKSINIADYDSLRYALFATQTIEIHTIFYDSLELELTEFLKSNNGQCIFDVSAVTKAYLIDIFVLLLEKGATNIHVFELKRPRRTYDENELIHNLSLDGGDYEFVNLAEGNYTKGKAVQSREGLEKQEKFYKDISKAIDILATNFARWILGIYLAVVIASVVSIAGIIISGNWSKFEPWITILFGTPFISYLLGIFVQVIFQKKLSLEPSSLFEWLKNLKKKQLLDLFK